MRSRFDEEGNPDIKVVVAEYRDAVRKRMRWIGPAVGGILLALLILSGLFSVDPGEVGVIRTFGKKSALKQPGLHFAFPVVQRVDIVDIAGIRRSEIGFRTGKNGTPKLVESEAEMLTGDENIVEAQMIVQYQISDPEKFLFDLKDPTTSLLIAAEVALRGVVGQMTITSSIEEFKPRKAGDPPIVVPEVEGVDGAGGGGGADASDGGGGAAPVAAADDKPAETPTPTDDEEYKPQFEEKVDESSDILTKGRERAQIRTKEKLQELVDLYESGIRITEVKLLPVDVPAEVKDAFHDVVRAREEREKMINKARSYQEDKIPRARGESQKIIRSAEAYKRERVLRAQGEAARFTSVLAEYKKARGVTRERLHLEVLERVLGKVDKKVFIDADVAKNALPFLPIGGGNPLGNGGGAQ